jgi:hypothetical protein
MLDADRGAASRLHTYSRRRNRLFVRRRLFMIAMRSGLIDPGGQPASWREKTVLRSAYGIKHLCVHACAYKKGPIAGAF